ncbi:hypothetical protein RI129_005990 [Pyrocoelia pectoralis]|uniref:Uncharacterized protein n=1 Tax=Pyrocoelia pectoralis TaxID=417401 RepID=A0AAN7ZFU1_9COLE
MGYADIIKEFLITVLIICACTKLVDLKSDNPTNHITNENSQYRINLHKSNPGIRSVGSRGSYQNSDEKVKISPNLGTVTNNTYIRPNLNNLLNKLPTRSKLFPKKQDTHHSLNKTTPHKI